MSKSILKQLLALSLLLLGLWRGLTFESHEEFSLSTSERRELPNIQPNFTDVTESINEEAQAPIVPEETSSDEVEQDPITAGIREIILGERQKPSGQSLCEEVSVSMKETSKLLASDNSVPYMEQVLNVKLVTDYRKIFPIPVGEEKIVVLKCRATIQYSIKVEAETDFFLVADSDRNLRVRWEPDNSTARRIP
jgi:hypothetical protein